MEFKVGDKVEILDRIGDESSYHPRYTDYMLKYAGTLTSIKKITGIESLILDNNNYYWDKKAVKLVNEEEYLHPSELKDGDFIKIWNDGNGFIYIFKEYEGNYIYRYVSIDLKDHKLNINPHTRWYYSSVITKITYATEEEKNLLNEALLKESYIWNNLTKKLESVQVTTLSNSSNIGIINSVMDDNLRITNSYPTGLTEEKINKEELNLFPTKKHYQLNFNY